LKLHVTQLYPFSSYRLKRGSLLTPNTLHHAHSHSSKQSYSRLNALIHGLNYRQTSLKQLHQENLLRILSSDSRHRQE